MKQTFNIRIRNLNKSDEYPDDTRLVPVEGKIIETHDLLPMQLFIHRAYDSQSWNISELTTGFSMIAGGRTQKDALQLLTDRKARATTTTEGFIQYAKDTLAKYGKAN